MMSIQRKQSKLRASLPGGADLFPHWDTEPRHPRKRPFVFILALIVLLTIGVGFAQTKKSTSQLKGQLKSIKVRKDAIRAKLKKVRGNIRNAQAEVSSIEGDIDVVETRYQRSEDRLGDAKQEQVRLTSRLKEAKEDFEVKSEDARQRLKYIRMHGKVSFASAIVSSKGVSDLASRAFVFKRIAAHDKELFEEVRNLMAEIDTKKKRSDQLVTEINGIMEAQREDHAELTAYRQVKKEILGELYGQASELEKLVRQLDAAENEVESIISARSGSYTGKKPGRLSYPVNARMTSPFGFRHHPILNKRRMHQGLDFGAAHGTTIRAAADGVIISASRNSGYGNVVIIDHGGGMTTVYAHCSSFIMRSGRVKRGQAIARVGSTGLSTGPHLHFEVRINGRAVNPRSYL